MYCKGGNRVWALGRGSRRRLRLEGGTGGSSDGEEGGESPPLYLCLAAQPGVLITRHRVEFYSSPAFSLLISDFVGFWPDKCSLLGVTF